MRKLAVVLALCVAGCQFAVGGVDPAGNGQPQPHPQPQPLLDGGAQDLAAAADLAKPLPPPPPPPPADCQTTGCKDGEQCVLKTDGHYACADTGGPGG